ncbi:hypothetical protein OE88DRAFT_117762 [Heliocybe sulcata]|uniref:Uncharacterized protein n=1 Tax=Heliocybe sulcata TaxID=5364 RepID=A0A5C3NLD7_9AGAM|nr:hypothetical protein OE88DRAFT_117762 [Heliocybe sulcata]
MSWSRLATLSCFQGRPRSPPVVRSFNSPIVMHVYAGQSTSIIRTQLFTSPRPQIRWQMTTSYQKLDGCCATSPLLHIALRLGQAMSKDMRGISPGEVLSVSPCVLRTAWSCSRWFSSYKELNSRRQYPQAVQVVHAVHADQVVHDARLHGSRTKRFMSGPGQALSTVIRGISRWGMLSMTSCTLCAAWSCTGPVYEPQGSYTLMPSMLLCYAEY